MFTVQAHVFECMWLTDGTDLGTFMGKSWTNKHAARALQLENFHEAFYSDRRENLFTASGPRSCASVHWCSEECVCSRTTVSFKFAPRPSSVRPAAGSPDVDVGFSGKGERRSRTDHNNPRAARRVKLLPLVPWKPCTAMDDLQLSLTTRRPGFKKNLTFLFVVDKLLSSGLTTADGKTFNGRFRSKSIK